MIDLSSILKGAKDIALALLAISVLLVGAILTLCSGSALDWVENRAGLSRERNADTIEIIQLDRENPAHRGLDTVLRSMWYASGLSGIPTVRLYKSTEVNAASLGYGRFLFSEAVTKLSNPQRDAIIAHELGHELENHAREMEDLIGLVALAMEVLAVVSGSSKEREREMGQVVVLSALPTYSRSQEFEADAKAVEILRVYGYETDAEGVYAATLAALIDSTQMNSAERRGAFFSTHPALDERIDRVEQLRR